MVSSQALWLGEVGKALAVVFADASVSAEPEIALVVFEDGVNPVTHQSVMRGQILAFVDHNRRKPRYFTVIDNLTLVNRTRRYEFFPLVLLRNDKTEVSGERLVVNGETPLTIHYSRWTEQLFLTVIDWIFVLIYQSQDNTKVIFSLISFLA